VAFRFRRAASRLTFAAMCHIVCHMKTATIRQMRHDLGTVLTWVAEGEEVTVLKRSKPVARLCPLRPAAPKSRPKMPDFAVRVQEVFGDKVIPNMVLEEREGYRW